VRSVIANSIATLAARLLVPVFSFAINVGIARFYGVELLGIYVYLIALVLVFQTAAGAGMPALLTRDIAADPARTSDYVGKARAFALINGGAATAAYALLACWILPLDRLAPALALGATVLPSAWMAIQEAYFMARREHHWIAVLAFVENAAKIALAALAFAFGFGLMGLCLGVAAARLAAFVLGERLMRKLDGRPRVKSSRAELIAFGKAVIPFAALMTLAILYFKIDVLLLEALQGERETGFYAAAVTLQTLFLLLPSSATAALYPRLCSMFRETAEDYAKVTLLSTKLLTAGIAPFSLLVICFSDRLLALVYGQEFTASAPTLALLAAALPFHAANGVLGQSLQAGRLQIPALKVVCVGLLTHVVLILGLVPRLGMEGAAVSQIVSAIVVGVGTYVVFRQSVETPSSFARIFFFLVVIFLPIAVTIRAPVEWRWLVGAAGLFWLAAATWLSLDKLDVDKLMGAVRSPRPRTAS
jgi:O-antigen/teichoic acid export membrane protein